MTINNLIYRPADFVLPVQFQVSAISEAVILTNLRDASLPEGQQNRGCLQPMKIGFPADWLQADVSFIGYDTETDAINQTNGEVMHTGDVNGKYAIPDCAPSTFTPLFAPWFAAMQFFRIESAVAQVASPTIKITCFPISQEPG